MNTGYWYVDFITKIIYRYSFARLLALKVGPKRKSLEDFLRQVKT
jgi:hypothetical protein